MFTSKRYLHASQKIKQQITSSQTFGNHDIVKQEKFKSQNYLTYQSLHKQIPGGLIQNLLQNLQKTNSFEVSS